jgi:phosphoribosyl 1,2-cyclic phosphodiesterase
MRIEFYGVRGTVPLTNPQGSVFGRNTACVAVTSGSGDLLVLDAGTGIRELGDGLTAGGSGRPPRIHVLLTHFHFDHVQGLPFFKPLFSPAAEILFYSGLAPRILKRTLARFMAPPHFPASFEDTASKKSFFRIGERPVRIGDLDVSALSVPHPQPCSAYKVEEAGFSFVFATDTEPQRKEVDRRLAAFARRASVLVYDAMYTPEDYEAGKSGWGHSTWVEAVKLGRAADVGRLLLFHLNPDYSDADLLRIEDAARKDFPGAACAREGPLDVPNPESGRK